MQGWFTGNLWVDLFVRSWVEICWRHSFCMLLQSTSSWGRELKCTWSESQIIELSCRPPCEVVSWNYQNIDQAAVKRVDLLVRSWVEIIAGHDGLWCLKCRPPREVVSWNMYAWSACIDGEEVDLLARSWVEIICKMRRCIDMLSRPPCEVVSWNYGRSWRIWNRHKVDLLVSWNVAYRYGQIYCTAVDLLARSWIEIRMHCISSTASFVTSRAEATIEMKVARNIN